MLLSLCIRQDVIMDYQFCMENENSQAQFIRFFVKINDNELTKGGNKT